MNLHPANTNIAMQSYDDVMKNCAENGGCDKILMCLPDDMTVIDINTLKRQRDKLQHLTQLEWLIWRKRQNAKLDRIHAIFAKHYHYTSQSGDGRHYIIRGNLLDASNRYRIGETGSMLLGGGHFIEVCSMSPSSVPDIRDGQAALDQLFAEFGALLAPDDLITIEPQL